METRENILQVAQDLMQRRGIYGWSYDDISQEVGIKKASIHYHFPKKEDLIGESIERYLQIFLRRIQLMTEDKNISALELLKKFIAIFAALDTQSGKSCLCFMATTDATDLPDKTKVQLLHFFQSLEDWIAKRLLDGEREGVFPIRSWQERQRSSQVLALALQGALLLSRLQEKNTDLFQEILEEWVNNNLCRK